MVKSILSVVRSLIAAFVAGAIVGATPVAAAATLVPFADDVPAGTIVVRTGERRLYLVQGGGHALRYSVGVGRPDRQWAGNSVVVGKYLLPNWAPPAEIRRDKPGLPEVIPGGSPANPLGAAALTLSGGNFAIHGTNTPDSVGGFVSYGCIRMYNDDIADLYARVPLGTPVIVTR